MTIKIPLRFDKSLKNIGGNETFFVEKIWKCIHTSPVLKNIVNKETIDFWFGDNCAMIKHYPEYCGIDSFKPKKHAIVKNSRLKFRKNTLLDFYIFSKESQQLFRVAPRLKVYSVQNISIRHFFDKVEVKINNVCYTALRQNPEQKFYEYDFAIYELSRNEGFLDADHFFYFFNKNFDGKIIHWTKIFY